MASALFDKGSAPPCPQPFNLAEYVLAQGAQTPDKIALAVMSLTGAERWSYGKLIQAVRATATGLLRQGLKPKDRVLIRIGNRVEFPISYLAALAVDMIPVPTSAMLTSGEITKIADEITPKLIIAEDGVPLPAPLPCPVVNVGDLASWYALQPATFTRGAPDRGHRRELG